MRKTPCGSKHWPAPTPSTAPACNADWCSSRSSDSGVRREHPHPRPPPARSADPHTRLPDRTPHPGRPGSRAGVDPVRWTRFRWSGVRIPSAPPNAQVSGHVRTSEEEQGMATGHLLDTYRASLDLRPPANGWSRPASVVLAHLGFMDTAHATQNPIEAVFTIAELATDLSVSTQALYDLRSKGRGPTGFRVGRQLRFRQSEIDAWLARLEG